MTPDAVRVAISVSLGEPLAGPLAVSSPAMPALHAPQTGVALPAARPQTVQVHHSVFDSSN